MVRSGTNRNPYPPFTQHRRTIEVSLSFFPSNYSQGDIVRRDIRDEIKLGFRVNPDRLDGYSRAAEIAPHSRDPANAATAPSSPHTRERLPGRHISAISLCHLEAGHRYWRSQTYGCDKGHHCYRQRRGSIDIYGIPGAAHNSTVLTEVRALGVHFAGSTSLSVLPPSSPMHSYASAPAIVV